jgi:outer membrane protein OmpA-like peptidoglycan-associated protein
MKKTATLILLILSLAINVNAQEQPGKKQVADNLFERYEYFKAVKIYVELADKNHPKIQTIERVADCYRLMNDYDNAEVWYQKAVGYPNAALIDNYYYAEVLLRNKKFNDAKEQYKLYYAKAGNGNELTIKLATCDSAQKWIKLPADRYKVKNEQKYNTQYSDWGINYYGKTDFVFTSDRNSDKGKKDVFARNGNGYFMLYRTDGDKVVPFPLKAKDNTLFKDDYNIGPIAFNKTEDTAYITISTTLFKSKIDIDRRAEGSNQRLYTRRLLLITATKTNGDWGNFKNFAYNNINSYSTGHATLSKNGNVLYFTSDMPGGQGKTDIWYCEKQPDGTWGKPINCGKAINTKDDEGFPVINGDSTLYFSSNGLPGMGGLDIFKAKGEKANWSKVENLKYPVNSTSDDLGYVTKDGLNGYFSSNREGGQGNDDIYSFVYNPPVVILPAPKKVEPVVVQPPVAVALPPLKKGDTFVLNNIYYDLNKSNIRPDAAVELDKLVDILKTHPTLEIEISSHTDSRAPATYNMALSNRRAASVVAYLVKQGIAADRLVPKGYGDTRLLNGCEKGVLCSEAEHQLNRRTEVRILHE